MSDEPDLRRLGQDDWEVLRDVRLRALEDSPDAFGSTLDRERDFPEKEWRRRLVRPVYAVLVRGRPVAMAGAFTDDGRVQVWGMWTDPGHRGRGFARTLLDALLREPVADALPVSLHVNTANAGARSVYERYGFVPTGELEPLRPGSDQRIELMRLRQDRQ